MGPTCATAPPAKTTDHDVSSSNSSSSSQVPMNRMTDGRPDKDLEPTTITLSKKRPHISVQIRDTKWPEKFTDAWTHSHFFLPSLDLCLPSFINTILLLPGAIRNLHPLKGLFW